jgi:hypothetical protein
MHLTQLNGRAMKKQSPPPTDYDAIDRDESSVHNWRTTQLIRLGIPGPLAEIYADCIDWHQIARLVRGGCPPLLALRIVW